jgi:hypothetical protein
MDRVAVYGAVTCPPTSIRLPLDDISMNNGVRTTVSVGLYNGFDGDNLRCVLTDLMYDFIHHDGLTPMYHNSCGPGRGVSCFIYSNSETSETLRRGDTGAAARVAGKQLLNPS